MGSYVARRLFYALLTFFGITVATFVLIHAVPGDPSTFYLAQSHRGTSAAALAAVRHEQHLDEPLPLQYAYWLHGIVTLDLGRSTVDSGTDRFKRQWGAQPVPLYWYRWERGARPDSDASAHEGQGRAMRLATALWQRLPLGVANRLGPLISGALPW